jgi:broad specificity phosphatase PhoE
MNLMVLRHAEKRSNAEDTELSDLGLARAEALARMLRDSGVSVVLHTDYRRSRQTAGPLLAALGRLGVAHEIPYRNDSISVSSHVAQVLSVVRSLAGGAVGVVIGHTDTIGPIIAGLGGPDVGAIGDGEFDNLFVVTSPPGGAHAAVVRLRYEVPGAGRPRERRQ